MRSEVEVRRMHEIKTAESASSGRVLDYVAGVDAGWSDALAWILDGGSPTEVEQIRARIVGIAESWECSADGWTPGPTHVAACPGCHRAHALRDAVSPF